CRYNHIFFNHSMVHHYCAHADQYMIFDRAAGDHRLMANIHIVTDFRCRSLISTVDHSTILDIGIISDFYQIYITPNHSIEPNGRMVTHKHIANDSGVFGNKTRGGNLWQNSFYWQYYRHNLNP